jgi:hypothetical protein
MAFHYRRTWARLVVGLGIEANLVSVCISHDSIGMGIRQKEMTQVPGPCAAGGPLRVGCGSVSRTRVPVFLLLRFCYETVRIDCSNCTGWQCIGNAGKKQLRPILRYPVDICLEQLRKTTKTLIQDSRALARQLPNASRVTAVKVPFVGIFFWCGKKSLAERDDNKLRVFAYKVLRRISVPKRGFCLESLKGKTIPMT